MGKGASQKTVSNTTPTFASVPSLISYLYPAISGKAEFIANRPGDVNPFRKTSEFNADEDYAQRMIRGLEDKYGAELRHGISGQITAQDRAKRAPNSGDLQPWMNPFTETVLNRSMEKIRESGDRDLMNIGSRSAMSNSFGGSRQALLEATSMDNTNRLSDDRYFSGMEGNFSQAMANYLGSIDRLSNMSGRTIDAAMTGQEYGAKDAALRGLVGADIRRKLDTDLGLMGDEWQRNRDEPLKELTALTAASGALTPGIGSNTVQTTTQTGNPLTQILGALSTGLGLLGGNPLGGLLGGGGSLAGGAGSLIANGVGGIWGGGGRGWKKGGPVASFAYGGRVGNPNTMGESAEVMQRTQNPFGALSSPVDNSFTGNLFSDPSVGGVGNAFVGPQQQSPTLFNPGPVASEMMTPPDVGGNPVARLLDMYRNGQPQGMGGSPMMFAGGGAVKGGYAEGGIARSAGGQSPVRKSLKDSLFSSDGLLLMGLSMLGSNGNPLEALSQGALQAIQYGQGGGNDPMEMLKLETQRLRNEDLQARMLDREDDDAERSYWREKDFEYRRQRDLIESQERAAARGSNDDWQAKADRRMSDWMEKNAILEAQRAAREEDKDKGKPSDYAGFSTAINSWNELMSTEGARPEEIEGVRDSLESYRDLAMNRGDEEIAAQADAALNIPKKRTKRAVNNLKDSVFSIFPQ